MFGEFENPQYVKRIIDLLRKEQNRHECRQILLRVSNWPEGTYLEAFKDGKLKDQALFWDEFLALSLSDDSRTRAMENVSSGGLSSSLFIVFEYYNGLKTEVKLSQFTSRLDLSNYIGLEYINTRAVPLQLPERVQG